MENNNETSILAAEAYLDAKQKMLPSTVIYIFKNTYNYILNKIPRSFR